MKRTLAFAASLLLAVTACGDDGPTGPGGGGGNDMEATVGGVAFNPPSLSVQGTFTTTQNTVVLAGVHTSGGITTSINIVVVGAVEGTPIQFTPTSGGTLATVTTTNGQVAGTSTWTTALSPGNGSITFTELDADHAQGTFQFTGQAGPGTAATGQKTVTSGTFDIDF